MCCEAKRWKLFAELIADPALYQRFPKPPFPQPSPEPVELDLSIYQSLLNFYWIFDRNPIEPDLDLHQNLPEPSQEPYWTWPASALNSYNLSATFSGTFARTLLNLIWLCIKSLWFFFRKFLRILLEFYPTLH